MTAPLRAKPLTDEGLRIINAILEDRFGENKHGRYIIDGEERPDRKTREQLRKRGLIESSWDATRKCFKWRVTAKGNAIFTRDIRARVEATRQLA